MRHYAQADRDALLEDASAQAYRKQARILAVRSAEPFTIDTDRGVMSGEAGDWIVTNHPEDDPGSDLWTISDARMRATYEPVE